MFYITVVKKHLGVVRLFAYVKAFNSSYEMICLCFTKVKLNQYLLKLHQGKQQLLLLAKIYRVANTNEHVGIEKI